EGSVFTCRRQKARLRTGRAPCTLKTKVRSESVIARCHALPMTRQRAELTASTYRRDRVTGAWLALARLAQTPTTEEPDEQAQKLEAEPACQDPGPAPA